MAPRDGDAARLTRDGRWRVEPNPVEWEMLPEYALPMAVRRDPVTAISLLFMTLPEECIAVSTPQEEDPHFSSYFSLFGGDLAAGESRRTFCRLVVAQLSSNGRHRDGRPDSRSLKIQHDAPMLRLWSLRFWCWPTT